MPPHRCLNSAIFLVLFWRFFWVLFWWVIFSICQCFGFQKTLRNHSVMPEMGIVDSETGRLQVWKQWVSFVRAGEETVLCCQERPSCIMSSPLLCFPILPVLSYCHPVNWWSCWSHFVYLSNRCLSVLICQDSVFHLGQYKSDILETLFSLLLWIKEFACLEVKAALIVKWLGYHPSGKALGAKGTANWRWASNVP